jgi:hypothetical protein
MLRGVRRTRFRGSWPFLAIATSLREKRTSVSTSPTTRQDVMLSDKQRQKALKINIEHAHNMVRDLRAEDADDVTLTY